MAVEGVKRIFNRSEQTRKVQYTEYFGDCSSKAHQEVQNWYENIHIKKECVDHVQKHVRTALRKLNKEIKGIGDSLIDELKNYYGIAIRSNSVDLSGMRSAIHESFFHCISSKKRNLYHHCRDRPDSWCSYKRDKANNTKFYKPGPGLL